MLSPETIELFGEPISVYTRAQAIADGVLVDLTEWGSATSGFMGGFRVPVACTRAVWATIDRKRMPRMEDVRGRAHDVLWMASLALRGALRRNQDRALFRVKMTRRYHTFKAVVDGDGVTIMEPGES